MKAQIGSAKDLCRADQPPELTIRRHNDYGRLCGSASLHSDKYKNDRISHCWLRRPDRIATAENFFAASSDWTQLFDSPVVIVRGRCPAHQDTIRESVCFLQQLPPGRNAEVPNSNPPTRRKHSDAFRRLLRNARG